MRVKVLDIDRERQRISLGLKQTQEDPWQRVMDTYHVGDVVEGKVTKVVSFGAFVEILDGVEGLVHISELAQHHVENPREVVNQGDTVRVKILEIDSERRRLSLSRQARGGPGPAAALARRATAARRPRSATNQLDDVPELGLSDDVFAGAEVSMDDRGTVEAPRGRGRRRGRASRGRRSRRRPRPSSAEAEAPAEPEAEEPAAEPEPEAEPEPAEPDAAEEPEALAEDAAQRPTSRPWPAPATGAPPFVGLTGGIGAGKSEALAALERLGAATLSTDAVVHELLRGRRGADAAGRALRRRVAPDGQIDRDAVAERGVRRPG